MGDEPADKFQWAKELRGDTVLTSTEYRVLLVLWTYSDGNLADAHPGKTRLAADACVSVSTVKNALRRLRELGYIVLTEEGGNAIRRGWADKYRLTMLAERERIAAAIAPAPGTAA